MAYPNEDMDPARGFSMNNQPLPRTPAAAVVEPSGMYGHNPQVEALNTAIVDAAMNTTAQAMKGKRSVGGAAPGTTVNPALAAAGAIGTGATIPAGNTTIRPASAAGAQVAGAARGFLPDTTGAIADAAQQVQTAPTLGAAIGQGVRGVAAATGGFVSDLATGAKNALAPVVNAVGTALTGDNTPMIGGAHAAPVIATAPAAQQATNPLDTRLATGQVSAPVGGAVATGTPAAAPAVAPALPAGVTKIVGADGGTTYTNTGQGFAPGTVTPQNMAAANALDANSRAAAATAAATAAAAGAPVAPAATVVGDGGGYGLLSNEARAARNRGFQVDALSQGMSQRQKAQLVESLNAADISRANTQDQVAVTREGQQLNAKAASDRLAVEKAAQVTSAATGAANVAHTNAQTQSAMDLQAAKLAYGAALQGGDPKAIIKSEQALRAAQGKWEKDTSRMMVVQGGTVLDPVTGQPVHQPSMVFDPDTGKFLAPPPQQGNVAAPAKAAIAEGTMSDVNGKKARYTNGKWVPI